MVYYQIDETRAKKSIPKDAFLYVYILLYNPMVSSTGQWSEPVISVWI